MTDPQSTANDMHDLTLTGTFAAPRALVCKA